MEFLKLAKYIDPSYYYHVGISLGLSHAQLKAILLENLKNFTNALLDVFVKWNVMQQPLHSNKRQLLAEKLREIDLGGLSYILLNEPLIPNSTAAATTIPPMYVGSQAAAATFPSMHADAQVTGVSMKPHETDLESDEVFDTLSKHVPHKTYTTLCRFLGIGYDEANSILARFKMDYQIATRDCLAQWKTRTGGDMAQLKTILVDAGVRNLVKYVK
eukprot:XP_011682384.1 PREDICTED: uncharacterized protein LOC105446816 isoform X2 [Strongylocentrotus purpuratus]